MQTLIRIHANVLPALLVLSVKLQSISVFQTVLCAVHMAPVQGEIKSFHS